jgi:hypothetical protein
MTPEICSVAGRRSGVAAVMSGDSILPRMDGLGAPYEQTTFAGFDCRGKQSRVPGSNAGRSAAATQSARFVARLALPAKT